MANIISLLLVMGLVSVSTVASECETGWATYKDELCIQASSEVYTHDEAKSYCASKSNGVTAASLVKVKESELQEFLSNLTKDNFENLWLGGKYDNESAQFKWDDGEPLTYTNWAEGYPRNITDAEVCIQLSPPNAKMTEESEGQWQDAVCQRRNLALCQRSMSWSFQDAVRAILNLRKELQAALLDLSTTKDQLQMTTEDLIITKEDLRAVNARVVPVGSIYVEYYSQPSPSALWPSLTWQDISNTYAGLFFRTIGGNSEQWEAVQNGCSPRISQVDFKYRYDSVSISLPKSGWSRYIFTGCHASSSCSDWEGIGFNVEDCEVRPQNRAIRIWKRLS